jgi:hypothetical protein
VRRDGGEVIPIELIADDTVIEQRLASASRREDGKLVDLDLFRRLRREGIFNSPVIPNPRLRIDTSMHSPIEAATLIVGEIPICDGSS